MTLMTYAEAVRDALAIAMERDERVFLMGEEVGYYNGAYKCSEGLLDHFGAKRVIDTPISAGIVEDAEMPLPQAVLGHVH